VFPFPCISIYISISSRFAAEPLHPAVSDRLYPAVSVRIYLAVSLIISSCVLYPAVCVCILAFIYKIQDLVHFEALLHNNNNNILCKHKHALHCAIIYCTIIPLIAHTRTPIPPPSFEFFFWCLPCLEDFFGFFFIYRAPIAEALSVREIKIRSRHKKGFIIIAHYCKIVPSSQPPFIDYDIAQYYSIQFPTTTFILLYIIAIAIKY